MAGLLGLLTANESQTGVLPQEWCQIPALEGMINLWDAASLTVQNQGSKLLIKWLQSRSALPSGGVFPEKQIQDPAETEVCS